MPASELLRLFEASVSLCRTVLAYAHVLFTQIAHTCLANGRSKLEERLARWLLMANDRVERDELSLTHDFLATMLGVRRPGVSVALRLLQKRGLIARARGTSVILDREGLRQRAYGAPEAEFERLFGPA